MTRRLDVFKDAFPRRTRPLLMTALLAGDPFLSATRDYMSAVVEGGADVIELVIPFSDPAYHGPVMRRASARAMSEGVDWEQLKEMIADFRSIEDEVPIIVSSYYNRVLACGEKRLVDLLADAGADGLLVTDLPFEESAELKALLESRDLALIQQAAPTTSEERFQQMAREAKGLIVWTGHCGTEVTVAPEAFREQMRTMRRLSAVPLVASMDVETGEDAMEVARSANGVLVGSALAWLIEGKGPDVEERLRAFVADLRINLDAVADL